ncbi:hypothetical protein OXV57_12375 [Bacteroides fragilis]|nr:hypothetical protein [Bacteroides fragilis]
MKKIIIPFVIMLISINVYFVEQSNQKVTESQTRLNDFLNYPHLLMMVKLPDREITVAEVIQLS